MNKKSVWVAGVIVFVIGFLSGSWMGSRSGPLADDSLKIQVQKLQDRLDRAKKFLPPMAEHVSMISGNVKSVSGNKIMLEATVFNPLEDLPPVRTIIITGATTITKIEKRDTAVYQKELAEFAKAAAAQNESQTPPVTRRIPNPYVQSPASLADITPGRLIQVTAAEDITRKESFEATKIDIIFQPNAP